MAFQFPWQEAEKRDLNYTELRLVEAASIAAGNVISAGATDAVTTAKGLYAAAIASCEVLGSPRSKEALTPEILSCIGRELVDPGQSAFYISTSMGKIKLIRATIHEVRGDFDPDTWSYFLNLATPSGFKSVTVPSRGMIHIRFASDPQRPWRGIGPVAQAAASGKLLSGLERMLGNELSWPSGWLLQVPSGSLGADASEEKSAALGAILGKVKAQDGASVMIHSRAEAVEYGDKMMARSDIKKIRVGAEGDQWLVQLRMQVHSSFLAALGVPEALGGGAESATNSREQYRSWLFSRVLPIAKQISYELAKKLNDPGLTLDLGLLRAGDLQGTARAAKSFNDAGFSKSEIVHILGLPGGSDD